MSDVRVSSFCYGGECVEVEFFGSEGVEVLRSDSAWFERVYFTHDEWRAFIAGVKNGEFDV